VTPADGVCPKAAHEDHGGPLPDVTRKIMPASKGVSRHGATVVFRLA
jgi:hypothetical protein